MIILCFILLIAIVAIAYIGHVGDKLITEKYDELEKEQKKRMGK